MCNKKNTLHHYDVIIVGAGIAGCSLARELSAYNLSVAVLERSYDIASGATRSNSGIVHGGYDPLPGTKKSYYNLKGKQEFSRLSKELGFRYQERGTLLIALNEDELLGLNELYQRGVSLGVEGLKKLSPEEVLELEPNLNPKVKGAMLCESAGICDPFGICVAYAENAAANGVDFYFEHELCEASRNDDASFELICKNAQHFNAQVVVNCAGVYADKVAALFGDHSFEIHAVAGEYLVFDRALEGEFKHTIFMVPSKLGKGVLVTPTVEGNILVGPNAYDREDKLDLATHATSLQEMLSKAQELTWPALTRKHIIQNFCGLRPKPREGGDFIIGASAHVEGLYHIAAFESPGLTAAPAVALELSFQIAQKLSAVQRQDFIAHRTQAPRFIELSDEERKRIIEQDPNYAHILCRCEQVTKAEILACMDGPLPVYSIEAIKRRCRAGTGRCQGGFCAPVIAELIASKRGCSIQEVLRAGSSTELAPYKRGRN